MRGTAYSAGCQACVWPPDTSERARQVSPCLAPAMRRRMNGDLLLLALVFAGLSVQNLEERQVDDGRKRNQHDFCPYMPPLCRAGARPPPRGLTTAPRGAACERGLAQEHIDDGHGETELREDGLDRLLHRGVDPQIERCRPPHDNLSSETITQAHVSVQARLRVALTSLYSPALRTRRRGC